MRDRVRRLDERRGWRLAGYILIGILAGLVFGSAAIFFITRSDWGMERARRFVVSWLDDRIDGELRLGSISGPGLMRGAMIRDFAIIGPDGRPFLAADSLELVYQWRTLLAGRILLDRVALHQPAVIIERLAGDSIWNYERIFGGGTPDEAAARNLIMFNDARIHNGSAVVRTPWEPDGPVEPGDTSRLILIDAPGGLLRAMRFEDINARLNRVIWESPIEKGRLFDVQSVSGRGFVWREPFQLTGGRGTLTMRDSVVTFEFPHVALPGSEASILGRVVMRTGSNDIDVRVDARRMVFRDLEWIYPHMPDDGGGSMRLLIQSQPDGTLWLAEEARIQAPGTSIAGTFGVVSGETLYFTRVDLRAAPLDIRTIEQLLPDGLPVDGLLMGTVEVRGPLN